MGQKGEFEILPLLGKMLQAEYLYLQSKSDRIAL